MRSLQSSLPASNDVYKYFFHNDAAFVGVLPGGMVSTAPSILKKEKGKEIEPTSALRSTPTSELPDHIKGTGESIEHEEHEAENEVEHDNDQELTTVAKEV